MSRAFDGNDYRKRVLAAVDARGGAGASDPFEVYDVPLDDAERLHDADVAAQVDAVWAFWQKQRDHPKYRGLVTALLARHDEVAPLLRDARTRGHLAADARRFRGQRDDARFADLDSAVDRLVERFGGIPAGKLDGLRAFAAAAGLDGPGTERRLARHRVVDDGAAAQAAPGLDAAVHRQVRGDLDELGQLLGGDPPATLYDLLGLSPGASAPEVRAAREAALARNRELRPDRRRALVDDLLAAVTALLLDGDPDAYLDAVARDVEARLRPRVVAAVLVEDALTADDAELLLREAEQAGLDPDRARRVLSDLAREAGTRLPTVPLSRPAPARPSRPARPEPPSAGAWSEPLAGARAALRAGRVLQAQQLLAQARQLAGGTLPPIRAVDDEVTAVLERARQLWRDVLQALAAGRCTTAASGLERLVQVAVDLPAPDGTTVADALARARAGLEAAGDRLAAAEALSGDARELALLAAAETAPDHEGLLAALRELGVAPARDVRVEPAGQGARVTWRPSTSPGRVDYEVRRDGRRLGTTQACELEVAAAGATASYVVVARRAGLASAEARSASSGPQAPAGTATPAPATAAALPVVRSLVVLPLGRRLRLVFPPPDAGRAEVRRLPDGVPPPAEGAPVSDPDRLGPVVPAMSPGLAVDVRPAQVPTTYVVLTADAATAVAGASATYVEPAPVSGLRLEDGRLRWEWPSGCTEALLAWRGDEPPQHARDPQATGRKTTNTRYELDGGVEVPDQRPLHVAVFTAVRVSGTLHAAVDAPPGARLHLGVDA